MAEVPQQSNLAIMILSKLKQFHSDGRYWDVQIQVDAKVFKCQRSLLAAHSAYFDTMFSGNFEESNTTTDQPITLHELDATAFEEFFSFMYTGDICVKDSNVLQLLFINDFLQLCHGHVKERCLEYLKRRSQEKKTMSNALDLLRFAHLKEENVLVDILRAHISRHLYHYYSKDAQLMEISSEILSALLEFSKNYILPLPGSADILLKIVYKWINHNREGRSQYRSNLMENIDFGRISSHFARSLIDGRDNLVDGVINLPKDIESLSELKMLAMEMDTNFTNGNVQFDGTITFIVENVNELQIVERQESSSCIISNLSWSLVVVPDDDIADEILVLLRCDGTDLCEEWNCYASATLTVVTHKKGEVFVDDMCLSLFSSHMNHLHLVPMYLNWNDVLDPEKGYIKEDNSLTLVVRVHADVPFLEMM